MTVKQALKECTLFSVLSDEELALIVSFAEKKQYDAGTTIFQAGDSAGELLVIEEGKVALQMTLPQEPGQPSRKVTIGVINIGDMIGWSAIVDPYCYTLTAVCLQEVRAISINGEKLRQLLRDNQKMGYEVLKGLTKLVASRLDETRQALVNERLLEPKLD